MLSESHVFDQSMDVRFLIQEWPTKPIKAVKDVVMKEPDPANFVMQIIYGIIGLFAFILIGGGITALVLYFSPDQEQPLDEFTPNPSSNSSQNLPKMKISALGSPQVFHGVEN